MEEEYLVSEGFHIPKNKGQVYGRFLNKLYQKSRRELTPERLVEIARDENCPLHDYFIWDNREAAYQYRLWQARYLLCAIKIDSQPPVRMLLPVKIKTNGNERQVFKHIKDINNDPELRRQIIQHALSEVIGWKERYKTYQELNAIFGAIEETQKTLFEPKAIKEKAKQRKPAPKIFQKRIRPAVQLSA